MGDPYGNITLSHKLNDGLANVMSGSGTSVDKRSFGEWLRPVIIPEQIDAAYEGSWLMRKVVDLPAYDMTRAWRDWPAEDDQIEKLEAEEKRLKVREKIFDAARLGRLGGAAIIIGIKGQDPAEELDVDSVGEGDLQYLAVVSRYKLEVGEPVEDLEDPDFGEPSDFQLLKADGGKTPIHRSRVICFKALPCGGGGSRLANAKTREDKFWGTSVVTVVDDAVKNADTACNEFASLILESKIDVFGVPDMLSKVGNVDYEKRLMRRLELAQQGKSQHRALIKDAAETWEEHEKNWGGIPEIIQTYLAVVAGAADIPATRLLGKAPDGMNATGEGDQYNYDQMIRSKQDNELRPKLEMLDEVLVPSALGSFPDEVGFEFAPLSVMTEKEAAEVENKEADTLSKLSGTGLFEDAALEEAFSNRMIESQRWPGYEKARKDAIKKAEEEPEPTLEEIAGLDITQSQPPGNPAAPANQPPVTQPPAKSG